MWYLFACCRYRVVLLCMFMVLLCLVLDGPVIGASGWLPDRPCPLLHLLSYKPVMSPRGRGTNTGAPKRRVVFALLAVRGGALQSDRVLSNFLGNRPVVFIGALPEQIITDFPHNGLM